MFKFKRLNINRIKEDLEKIEILNNKEDKTEEDLLEGHRIFRVFSNFIKLNYGKFKRFKKEDRNMYVNIYDWTERQKSVVSSIRKIGFREVIDGDEEESDWIIYEAWLLGYLIVKYKK